MIAVDNDPKELTATRDNAERNNTAAQRISNYLPDEVPHDAVGHTMWANTLAAPLIQLSPRLIYLTAANGQLCLSGLLEHPIEAVSQPHREAFKFDSTSIESEWAQLSARKHSR